MILKKINKYKRDCLGGISFFFFEWKKATVDFTNVFQVKESIGGVNIKNDVIAGFNMRPIINHHWKKKRF